jgi:hypothetical protein
MSIDTFRGLGVQPELDERPGTLVVGNGQVLDVAGWTELKFSVLDKDVMHEIGILHDLPVPMLLGGEFMAPHQAELRYKPDETVDIRLGRRPCLSCKKNFERYKDHQQLKILPDANIRLIQH